MTRLRSTALYGAMRAMHHLALRQTGRKPPVAKKTGLLALIAFGLARTECQGKVQGLPGLFAEGLFRPELSPGQQMSQVADAAEKGSAESGGMTGLQADGQSTRDCIRCCILMVKIVVQRRHARGAPSVTVAASGQRLAQRFLPRYLCLCQSNRPGEVKVGQWFALLPRANGPEEVGGANQVCEA